MPLPPPSASHYSNQFHFSYSAKPLYSSHISPHSCSTTPFTPIYYFFHSSQPHPPFLLLPTPPTPLTPPNPTHPSYSSQPHQPLLLLATPPTPLTPPNPSHPSLPFSFLSTTPTPLYSSPSYQPLIINPTHLNPSHSSLPHPFVLTTPTPPTLATLP